MNQMQAPALISETLEDKILTLTLGAGVAHPLSLGMIKELLAAISAAEANPDVHVMVIHGPGKIFCAGHDLKEIARHRGDADQGLAFVRELFEACGEMMQAITMSPKPSIAVVEGIATAGGLQLVAACDLAFAGPKARVCLPGISNGGFCTTPSVAVARNIGRKAVMELALSGEAMDAEWGQRAGLFNRVVNGDVLEEAKQFAQIVAKGHPAALGLGKRTLYQQLEMPLPEAYAHATEAMISHFMDPERIRLEKAGKYS
ncbi:MAG: enoyl-CoA hydratase-related protein [Arenibacterium sp.]